MVGNFGYYLVSTIELSTTSVGARQYEQDFAAPWPTCDYTRVLCDVTATQIYRSTSAPHRAGTVAETVQRYVCGGIMVEVRLDSSEGARSPCSFYKLALKRNTSWLYAKTRRAQSPSSAFYSRSASKTLAKKRTMFERFLLLG